MQNSNPEDMVVREEELRQMIEEAHDRIQLLINITFHRKELFDAWYAHTINSSPITTIAAAQNVGWKVAKHRIDTAQEIIFELRKKLHEIDDVCL